jgi:hypothetical protein
MKKHVSLLLVTGIFAMAMGFLESAVVVYLRQVYYPSGFQFPLHALDPGIVLTEVLREAATMIMLLTVSFLAVSSAIRRFAIFIYAFAVWDIFYYIFLRALLGWPSSFFTWDILFLIPVTWVGPVLAPVINSITMILLGVAIILLSSKNDHFRIVIQEWIPLLTGSAIIVIAYVEPYMTYMLSRFTLSDLFRLPAGKEVMDYTAGFIPVSFNWLLFSAGEFLFFYSIFSILKRNRRK